MGDVVDCLLTDALVPLHRTSGEGPTRVSLAAALAMLTSGEVVALGETARHNEPFVHAFFSQIAVLALQHAGKAFAEAPTDPDAWASLLRGLTPSHPDDAPWRLTVADPETPAFLQPAIPKADAGKMEPLDHPGELSILVTARNHTIKSARGDVADPWAWVQTLIAVQTGVSFSGRGNPGVARMNGGFGSRPFVSLVPGSRWDHAWARDVAVMLEQWQATLAAQPALSPDGHALLWCLPPWGGTEREQLPLTSLRPHFIEIARRIRLSHAADGTLRAAYAGTEKARISSGPKGAEYKGAVGDPWMPLAQRTGGALTLPEEGWTYARVVGLLLGQRGQEDYVQSLLQKVRPEDAQSPEPHWHLRVLVGGQGKTGGWHERRVSLSPQLVPVLAGDDGRLIVADIAHEHIGNAAAAHKALLAGLLSFLERSAWKSSGEKTEINWKDREATAWSQRHLDRLEQRIDAEFFPYVWREAGPAAADDWGTAEAESLRWRLRLKRLAEEVFEEAVAAFPASSMGKIMAHAVSAARLRGALRRGLELAAEDGTLGAEIEEEPANE